MSGKTPTAPAWLRALIVAVLVTNVLVAIDYGWTYSMTADPYPIQGWIGALIPAWLVGAAAVLGFLFNHKE